MSEPAEIPAEIQHIAGDGVVEKRWYANPDSPGTATVVTMNPSDEAIELWQDAAFTNDGPLVKIELVWSPDEAAKLAAETK